MMYYDVYVYIYILGSITSYNHQPTVIHQLYHILSPYESEKKPRFLKEITQEFPNIQCFPKQSPNLDISISRRKLHGPQADGSGPRLWAMAAGRVAAGEGFGGDPIIGFLWDFYGDNMGYHRNL